MRIVVAPNAFKGSLGPWRAARAMARGVRKTHPRAKTILAPISDGGDGLVEALTAGLGGRRVRASARGPLGRPRAAVFGWLPDGTAVIEMALASGLALVPPGRRDPLKASSFGTGELIAAALRRGARRVLVGLGGSASNDGGAGMAQALGVRLLDKDGRELGTGIEELAKTRAIDPGSLSRSLRGVEIVGLTDVVNPLLGPRGSARVYAPQKGATKAMIPIIEEALSRLSEALKRDLGRDVAGVPGAGAAGGLGAGLMGFLGARLEPGAPYVLERLGMGRLLDGADAVVTGEGVLDETSFFGKAPLALAALARGKGVPVACVCARAADGMPGRLRWAGVAAVATFSDAGASPRDSFARAARWAERAAAIAVKSLSLAVVLALLPAAGRAAAPTERIDALYFHRDQGDNLAKSQALIDEALAREPGEAALLWRRGRGLVRQGEALKAKKERLARFEAAVDALKGSIAVSSTTADAHFWLGVALGRVGQDRGILRSLFLVGPIREQMQETLALDPRHGGAHRVLAEVLWQLPGFAGGDKKRALSEFEKAVESNPAYTDNYVPLAEAYLREKRKDEAAAVLEKGLAVKDPADPADYAGDLKEMRELLAKIGP